MNELSILEIAENAKTNFETVVQINPLLGKQSIFMRVAMEQLKEVVERLEIEDKDNE